MTSEGIKKLLFGAAFSVLMTIMPYSGFGQQYPALSDELNDIPGDVHMGEWIQFVSSNTTEQIILLTNGVLTVGTNTIKISPAQHMVITTNAMDVVETNFYDAVFQDEMTNAIQRATNDLAAAIMEEVVTKPIDPDNNKASKIMKVWDFLNLDVHGYLQMNYNIGPQPPITKWIWTNDSPISGYSSLEVGYDSSQKKPWYCITNNLSSDTMYLSGSINTNVLDFSGLKFYATNYSDVAFVIYSDYLETNYVSRAEMGKVADVIEDENLESLNGVKATLQGIRSEFRTIAGGYSTRVRLRNIARGNVVRLGNVKMATEGDLVDIDWGDGSTTSATNFPIEHVYSNLNSSVSVTIDVKGRIKSIEGEELGPLEYVPWIMFKENADAPRYASIGTRFVDIFFGQNVGISELGQYAFCNMPITSLSFLPRTIDSITGNGCFYGCTQLKSLVGIPDTITYYPPGMFAVSGIETLEGMPQTVESIDMRCFSNCQSLRDLSGISVSITNVGNACFASSGITSLTGLSRASNLTSLNSQSFYMSAIQTVGKSDFPSSLVSIGEQTFAECPDLTAVYIPETVSVIGRNAFQNSGSEPEGIALYFEDKTIAQVEAMDNFQWGLTAGWTNINFMCMDGWLYPDGNSYVTNYTTIAMSISNVSNGTDVILGEMLIASEMMIDWGDGERTSIPLQVEPVVENHTYYTSYRGRRSGETSSFTIKVYGKVRSVKGHDGKGFLSIEGMDSNPFLTSLQIGNAVGIAKIGDSAFFNCPNLQIVCSYADGSPPLRTLPDSITEFGQSAFANCSSITSVEWFPASLASLGNGCFQGCSMLQSLSGISSTQVQSIPERCFQGCSSIQSLVGGVSGITEIGDFAFSDCTSLQSLSGLSAEVVLGAGSFQGDVALSDLTGFPARSTEIPEFCFSGCTGLLSVAGMPTSVEVIGEGAFQNALFVTNALLVGTFTQLGANCFLNLGAGVSERKTDMYGEYYGLIEFSSLSIEEFRILGGAAETGLPYKTRVLCSDGALAGDANNNTWIVYRKAFDIYLEQVPAGTEFMFADIVRTNAIAVFWGDGEGTTIYPEQSLSRIKHAYGADYNALTVTVSGVIQSIGGSGGASPVPFFYTESSDSNPCLTGITLYGNFDVTNAYRGVSELNSYCFFGCSNLKSLEGLSTISSVRDYRQKRTLSKLRSYGLRSSMEIVKSCVTNIGNSCFEGCTSLTSLRGLPRVESIRDRCFFGCSGLRTLEDIPETVSSLGSECFAGCIGLSSLNSLASTGVRSIPYSCFSGCTNLFDLASFPSLSTNIGSRAFADCVNIQSLIGMDTNVVVAGNGFMMNTGIENLEGMSPYLTTIPDEAFKSCKKLTSLYGIGSKVDYIGDFAFAYCPRLYTFDHLGEDIVMIGRYSFAQDTTLFSGVLHDSILSIGDNYLQNVGMTTSLFTDEAGLTASARVYAEDVRTEKMLSLIEATVNTNNFLEYVCSDGYLVCSTNHWRPLFKTLVIEMENVRAGTRYTLGNLTALSNSTVTVDWGDGASVNYSTNISHTYSTSGNYVVEIKGFFSGVSASANKYPFLTSGGRGNTNIVTVSVGEATKCEELGDFAFKGCSNLRSFAGAAPFTRKGGLQNSTIIRLGKECFAGCSSITNLSCLPPMLYAFGEGCFSNCTALASVEFLPEFITSLPDYCFAGCSSITNLAGLQDAVNTLGTGCFKGCTNLKDLSGLPEDISVGTYVFSDCTGLTNLNGYALSYLTEGLFKGCSGLTSLEGIPDGIAEIPDHCFSGCSSISSLNGQIPSTVTIVGKGAFQECGGLNGLIGLESVKTIGNYAFSGCSNIVSLSGLSTNVVSIGDYSFSNCLRLEGFGPTNDIASIAYTNASFSIGDYTFSNCPSFGGNSDNFNGLPEGVYSIGIGAFDGCDMSSLRTLPFGVTALREYVFGSTLVSNLTIETALISEIATNAFSDARNEVYVLDGLDTSRIIRMPALSTDGIVGSPNFPWGNPTTTRFIGYDGFVVYHNGEWLSLNISIAASIMFTGDSAVRLSGIIATNDVHGYSVSWGDGEWSHWLTSPDPVVHQYEYDAYPITNMVFIFRKINAIDTQSTNSFICCDSSSDVRLFYFSGTSGIERFGDYSFNRLTKMEEMPVLPSTVTSMGRSMFERCSSIPDLSYLPGGLTNISSSAFLWCTSATNCNFNLPNLNTIPQAMFERCYGLKTVTFNSLTNITSVSPAAFHACSSLESISLLPLVNLETIGRNVFQQCSKLSRISIPSSVSSIGTNAFDAVGVNADTITDSFIYDGYQYKTYVDMSYMDCSNIMSMVNFPWGASTSVRFGARDGDVVWEVDRWVAHYADIDMILKITEADRGKSITMRTFGYANGTNIVRWGDNTAYVTNIATGTGVLKEWTHTYATAGVYRVNLYGPVKELNGTTSGAIKRPFIYIPTQQQNGFMTDIRISPRPRLETIGTNCFANCMGLEFFSVSAEYKTVGTHAFAGCTNLLMVALSDSANVIGDEVFADCNHLMGVTLPNNASLSMGNRVFARCSFPLMQIQTESKTWPQMTSETLSPAYNESSEEGVQWRILAEKVLASSITNEYLQSDCVSDLFGLDRKEHNEIVCWDGSIVYATKNGATGWWLERATMEIELKGISARDVLKLQEPTWNWELFRQEDSTIYAANSIYDSAKTLTSEKLRVEIDWGDGTRETDGRLFLGQHRYAKGFDNIRITIRGLISVLKGGQGLLPFLTVAHGKSSLANKDMPAPVTSIKINDGMQMKVIEQNCFCGYAEMTNCILPSTVSYVGREAFMYSGIKSLSGLPRTLTNIQYRCFYSCTNLQSLAELPSAVTEIQAEAFAKTSIETLEGLSNAVGLVTLDSGCFAESKNLSDLSGWSPYIIEIPENCFKDSGISSLEGMGDNVQKLGKNAFKNCNISTFEHLSHSVTNLSNGSFIGCPLTRPVLIPSWIKGVHATALDVNCLVWEDGTISKLPLFYKDVEGEAGGGGMRAYLENCVNILEAERSTIVKNLSAGYVPLMQAVVNVSSNDVVYLGKMKRTEVKDPIVVTWGDGTSDVYYTTNTVVIDSAQHTYQSSGSNTITICGFVSQIGRHGNNMPFIGVNGQQNNPKIESFLFTDSVGLYSIGKNSFSGCQNLTTIKNQATVPLKDRLGLAQLKLDSSAISDPYYKAYVTYAFPFLNNYPFGADKSVFQGIERKNASLPFKSTYKVEEGEYGFGAVPNSFSDSLVYYITSEHLTAFARPNWYASYELVSDGYWEKRYVKTIDVWIETGRYNNEWGFWTPKDIYEDVWVDKSQYNYVHRFGTSIWYWKTPISGRLAVIPRSVETKIDEDAEAFVQSLRNGARGGTVIFPEGQRSRRATQRKRQIGQVARNTGLFNSAMGARSGQTVFKMQEMEYAPADTNRIADYIFYNNVFMTNMPAISSGVEAIGAHAFENTKIGDFGVLDGAITNIGERALASQQLLDYRVTIAAPDITLGEEVFGEHYPFGMSRKTVVFPEIEATTLTNMPAFPFARMMPDALGEKPAFGYVNEFTIYRCKKPGTEGELVDLHPMNIQENTNRPPIWVWTTVN